MTNWYSEIILESGRRYRAIVYCDGQARYTSSSYASWDEANDVAQRFIARNRREA